MKKVIFAIAVLLQVLPLLATEITETSSKGIDPKHYAVIDGRRYYFSPNIMTIPEAIFVCNDDNMTLAALETIEEYNAVNSYIAANLGDPYPHFTSGTRQSNSWVWASVGKHVTYFKWYPGEPRYTDTSTQANIYLINGFMYANPAYAIYKFICEQIG